MKHFQGQIEVICGPMFCGKSTELIRRVERAAIAGQNIQAFKPAIDNRYDAVQIAAHNGLKVEAVPVEHVSHIRDAVFSDTDVVAIDEAQFFKHGLVQIAEELANEGYRVVIAALDANFRGESFGEMGELLCRADYITKLTAICPICGEEATKTQRIVDGRPAFYEDPEILVGADESYAPRCREHHVVPHRVKVSP